MGRNISEVATGSRDIAVGITAVSGAVDSTRSGCGGVPPGAADELNATAHRLTELVGRFTV